MKIVTKSCDVDSCSDCKPHHVSQIETKRVNSFLISAKYNYPYISSNRDHNFITKSLNLQRKPTNTWKNTTTLRSWNSLGFGLPTLDWGAFPESPRWNQPQALLQDQSPHPHDHHQFPLLARRHPLPRRHRNPLPCTCRPATGRHRLSFHPAYTMPRCRLGRCFRIDRNIQVTASFEAPIRLRFATNPLCGQCVRTIHRCRMRARCACLHVETGMIRRVI